MTPIGIRNDSCREQGKVQGLRVDAPLRAHSKQQSGNIRHGEKWQGLAKVQNDASFCTFETATYINHVVNVLNIEETKEFDLNQDNLLILIKAIIKYENGVQPYSNETILKGINIS